MSSQMSTYRNKAYMSGARLLALLAHRRRFGLQSRPLRSSIASGLGESCLTGFSSQSRHSVDGHATTSTPSLRVERDGHRCALAWRFSVWQLKALKSHANSRCSSSWNDNAGRPGQPLRGLKPLRGGGKPAPHGCAAGLASTCFDYSVDPDEFLQCSGRNTLVAVPSSRRLRFRELVLGDGKWAKRSASDRFRHTCPNCRGS